MDEKVYFTPGMRVTVKWDIPNKPIMYVIKKESYILKKEGNDFKGIRCRWFTTDGTLQEDIFNTKDLQTI